jgi:pyruvate ferredoxin oxidoreductase alpha subunit
MLKQIEGSRAVAEAVALCRPEVICAYPISPQTHIVEGLGELVKSGSLAPCEFINVESEFAAMSVAIGASAAGARTYTATASQGLLFMAEAVYNASGLGLPIVMTVANRAIGAPINIWNDHSDSMSQRDCGWIQLFAETNQEALDLHIQAFKLAEELSMPVMVCMDGFILTHAYERVDMPAQAQVDAFLPPYEPRQVLDPAEPVSIGAMVGPEAFMEVRYLAHAKQTMALERIPQIAAEFRERSAAPAAAWCALPLRGRADHRGRARLGAGHAQGHGRRDARRGHPHRRAGHQSFRPFPLAAVREALQGAQARGGAGEELLGRAWAAWCRPTCGWRCRACTLHGYTVVAGLGGRAITQGLAARACCVEAIADTLPALTFLDLDWRIVERQLERERAAMRRSGPIAENLLRDIGTVASAR